MKSWLLALSLIVAGSSVTLWPTEADARRLGGGKSAGMQRQAPPAQPAQTPPQQSTPSTAPGNSPANAAQAGPNAAAPAAAGAAAAGGAAAAAKRSWMGPIAGIAAGLGIAALLSHMGLGGAFAELLTMLLLVVAAFFVLRFVMRRFFGQGVATGSNRLAPAGGTASAGFPPAGAERSASPLQSGSTLQRRAQQGASLAASGGRAAAAPPADFDAAAFEQIAKLIFIRMQDANDKGSVEDLRRFTTPDLFEALRADVQAHGSQPQRTDVVQLEAEVLETAQEHGDFIVSVRFHGLIRETEGAAAEAFDEVWHLVRPLDGSREWAIAGIAPLAVEQA